MSTPTTGEHRPKSAPSTAAARSADIPITSPVVERPPELLDVHRLALHLHRRLSDPAALDGLSGWIHQDARGYLLEAVNALHHVSRLIGAGRADV